MSNSKKRRVFTKPKRKDAKSPALTGFIGERFILRKGEVVPINVSVIGDNAFHIFRTQRHGIRRCEFVSRERLFATRDAAVRSMKPTLGYALVTWKKLLKPVRIVDDGNGNKTAYERRKKAVQVSGKLFNSKKEALEELKKCRGLQLKEKRREFKEANRAHEKVLKQIDQL